MLASGFFALAGCHPIKGRRTFGSPRSTLALRLLYARTALACLVRLLVYWSGVGRAGACAAAVYCGAHQSARAYRAVYYRLRDAAAPFAEEAAAPKQRPPSQPYEGVC